MHGGTYSREARNAGHVRSWTPNGSRADPPTAPRSPGPAPPLGPYTAGYRRPPSAPPFPAPAQVGFITNLKGERSHKPVSEALHSVGCMLHRGACSADGLSGDGVGLMTQVPWEIIEKDVPAFKREHAGVGQLFLPQDAGTAAECEAIIDEVAKEAGFRIVGYRDVPTDPEIVGRIALATMPTIKQLVVESEAGATGAELEKSLFLFRKACEGIALKKLAAADARDFYFCTLSSQTIVYKGMLYASKIGNFYKDLTNEAYVTNFAIYHTRFSTNTNPRWSLAQPFRFLGHNGEINTLVGNLNWAASRQYDLKHPTWEGHESTLFPLCDPSASDSANLDRVAELLVRTGFSAEEAMMVLVPEAYRNHPDLMAKYPESVSFYEYFEGLQEGWDGPALLVFSDGTHIGARLDRNGLRPARFWTTSDGMAYMASEVGVLGEDYVTERAGDMVTKGRLGPGQMILANLDNGKFYEPAEIAKDVASRRPYDEYLKDVKRLQDQGVSQFRAEPMYAPADHLRRAAAFGYSSEDTQLVIEDMAANGVEPTYCMGDDNPLAVLSAKPHMIYDYFKQRFAQVTNPPIDPLREGLVMSLEMRLGARGNLLTPGPGTTKQVLLESPILLESELEAIKGMSDMKERTFTPVFETGAEGAMEKALDALCADVEAAVRDGSQIVVLSDRLSEIEAGTAPIPMLLSVGAVHHHLIKAGLRSDTSIVADTAACVSTHHTAVLIGYGAHAVCPYMAYEVVRQWRTSSRTESLIKTGKIPNLSIADAQKNYKSGMEKGLKKILSKMGISLLSCYHGAQIFEMYGLGQDVIEKCCVGSVSRIGGMSLADLQRETEAFWAKGFPEKDYKKLENFGFIQDRSGLEYHANNQEMAKYLHKAVGLGGNPQAEEAYASYMEHFKNSPAHVLRDMLELDSGREAISIDEVEPVEEIMKRFCTGGMSLGAISRETHETIAIAMNRIGGKSNSGEGGEDPVRWEEVSEVDSEGKSQLLPHLKGLKVGDIATSRIKQVASGRFGVTPEFLVNADQLEIKVAQGAKPGEGGQLPGKKVSTYIAFMRRSKPGVTLISPPPHHDIYSIEDLAQLIYDLHAINPNAKVSVKLVAQAGIGTVASGVAKADADIIQISGHDGGTGASPVSSIKHCGGPVEMGVMETHQQLVANELRDRVVLRADGGMRNGRDVLMAAAMGADEYGFGTIAMVSTGCIMARVCHTNNCPVGVASQREELRARFPGAPSDLVHFFEFVAQEVRAELARLGFKSIDEVVGRSHYLVPRKDKSIVKTQALDLGFLRQKVSETETTSSQRLAKETISNGFMADDALCEDKEILACIAANSGEVVRDINVSNLNRTFLARLAGVVAKEHGDRGFKGTLRFNLKGSLGQSSFAFLAGGIDVNVQGECNDYVCKGMAGGRVAVSHPEGSKYDASQASLVGNTCLYGATGGKLFVNGRAGERFAVRNSMADAVVEGTGDHCCEYMTGGCIVSLGEVGRNVGAGMTGGIGYFLDTDGTFESKINREIVAVQRVETKAGEKQLKDLITEHVECTGSKLGQDILDNWAEFLPKFVQLVPPSEANTPMASKEADAEAVTA